MSALADDLLAPEVVADPYPHLARLQREDPVHWSERHRGWLLTRYDDVLAAYSNPALSSDRVRPLLARLDPEQRAGRGAMLGLIENWMVVTDPPAHTRLRRLVAGVFRPHKIEGFEAHLARLVDELLDRFVARGSTDLVADYAYQLPATVIAELMGAPVDDRERFRDWSSELALVAFGAGGEAREERHERALRGLQELQAYLDTLIERAKAEPGDDMISGLLEGDGSGERLTDEEIRAMCALMLFAGHETTTNLISSGIVALLEHPDELAKLRADPSLNGKAVEELLRFDGPIKVLTRWVVEDFELRGSRIEAGQRVFLVQAAANRDPERFAGPDRLDLERSPNPHLAFGRGVHTCIGAQLARMEGRHAILRAFERLPGLRLAEQELRWHPTLAARALVEVRVTHDA